MVLSVHWRNVANVAVRAPAFGPVAMMKFTSGMIHIRDVCVFHQSISTRNPDLGYNRLIRNFKQHGVDLLGGPSGLGGLSVLQFGTDVVVGHMILGDLVRGSFSCLLARPLVTLQTPIRQHPGFR